jgi:hypothetical protein
LMPSYRLGESAMQQFRMIAGLDDFRCFLGGGLPIRRACACLGPPSRFLSPLLPVLA